MRIGPVFFGKTSRSRQMHPLFIFFLLLPLVDVAFLLKFTAFPSDTDATDYKLDDPTVSTRQWYCNSYHRFIYVSGKIKIRLDAFFSVTLRFLSREKEYI